MPGIAPKAVWLAIHWGGVLRHRASCIYSLGVPGPSQQPLDKGARRFDLPKLRWGPMAFRAFISVDVGPRIDWHALRKELTDVDRGVRTVRPEQFHLTLRFLGDTDEGLVDGLKSLMERSVEGVDPFRLSFEGVGAFPSSKRPRVVWIGLKGAEPLMEIAHRLEEGVVALGWQSEKRGFRPHATVARIKYIKRLGRLTSLLDRWHDRSFGSVEVGAVYLKRSELSPQGATHTTVHTVELGE